MSGRVPLIGRLRGLMWMDEVRERRVQRSEGGCMLIPAFFGDVSMVVMTCYDTKATVQIGCVYLFLPS